MLHRDPTPPAHGPGPPAQTPRRPPQPPPPRACVHSSVLGMQSDDLFLRLAAGAHFSKKDLVRERKAAQSLAKKAASVPPAQPDEALPAELDFFSSPPGTAGDRPETCNGDSASTTMHPGPTKPIVTKVPKRRLFATEEEIHAFRKQNNIRVYGVDVPPPAPRFVDLARPAFGVPLSLVQAVREAGLKKPTPVQMQATTVLLAERDAFVVAPTGSGKTLAFIMAILSKLLPPSPHPSKSPSPGGLPIRAIIVSPTRELALQIKDEFRRFTPRGADGRPLVKSVLLNKTVLNSWQAHRPTNYPPILITTPQRLVTGIERGVIDLSHVVRIILDEADRLLDLGLLEQLDDILAACTCKEGPIQKALFSATIPSGVEDLARSFMNEDPIRVVIGTPNASVPTIKQRLVYVGQEEGKIMAIQQMLVQGIEPPVIIFAETIERAQMLFAELVKFGLNVDMIHSGRTQTERERIIEQFRAGRIWFLITTELLARGLDFPEVACVINYDFPASTASYIHRIGRTGRAGKKGRAITLFTHDDVASLRIVANVMRQSGCKVPEWMLALSSAAFARAHQPTSKPHRKRPRASGLPW